MKIVRLPGSENGVFGGLGDAEFHNSLSGNFDGLPLVGPELHGLFASGSIDQHELAETGNREGVLGLLVSKIGNRVESLGRLLFGDTSLLGNCRGDLRFGHCFCHSLFSLFVVVLVYESLMTWFELKTFSRSVQAKNQKFSAKIGAFLHTPIRAFPSKA